MEKKRVLIVEDDASIAFLIKEHLADLGPDYEIGAAASGEEALRAFDSTHFDLVVTDNKMPGLTGVELIQLLKEKRPDLCTVLMTGYGSEEVSLTAQRLQVFHYLTKPFPLADLSGVIKQAFALPQPACPRKEYEQPTQTPL